MTRKDLGLWIICYIFRAYSVQCASCGSVKSNKNWLIWIRIVITIWKISFLLRTDDDFMWWMFQYILTYFNFFSEFNIHWIILCLSISQKLLVRHSNWRYSWRVMDAHSENTRWIRLACEKCAKRFHHRWIENALWNQQRFSCVGVSNQSNDTDKLTVTSR